MSLYVFYKRGHYHEQTTNFYVIVLIGILAVITIMSPGLAKTQSMVYATPLALLPSIIAIALALITKEVYTFLFTGIIMGALLYSNFNLEKMMNTFLFHEEGGMIYKLSDSWNVGILIFLVLLGILVSVLNRAGGQCNHVSHVSTQLPYVITVSAVCCVGYILIGILNACGLMNLALLALPISIVVLIGVLFVIRAKTAKKNN